MPSSKHRSRAKAVPSAWELRLAEGLLWLLLFIVCLLLAPTAQESFRLPKLLAAEVLALASLVPLALRLRARDTVELGELWRPPVVQSVFPFLAIATLGVAATAHAAMVREGLIDLWIGAAALVGWSLGLPRERLRRLLTGLVAPAALLALLGILQIHGLVRPLGFFGLEGMERMQWTSLAGNPGDLAGLLALAAVAAQAEIHRRRGRGRWLAVGLLGILLYALVGTRTLGGIAAVAAGSLVFWGFTLSRKRFLGLVMGSLAALVAVALLVSPVRDRLSRVTEAAQEGRWNTALTGRLDGWRAALWMTAEHPVTGVGHGAFGAEYVEAKQALLSDGVEFSRSLQTTVFANAHNELLEVLAETGIPGLLALGLGLWVLVGRMRRIDPDGGASGDRGLAWGGFGVLAVLSLVHFPFRLALTAYPAILWLAWIFRAARAPGPEEAS